MDTDRIAISHAADRAVIRTVGCGDPPGHTHTFRGSGRYIDPARSPIVPRRCDLCGAIPPANDDISDTITIAGARVTRRRWYWIPAGRLEISICYADAAGCYQRDRDRDRIGYGYTDQDMPPPNNARQRNRYRAERSKIPASTRR